MTSTTCNQFFIGSTTQQLHQRVKVHQNNKESALNKHFRTCDNSSQQSINVPYKFFFMHDKKKDSLRLHEALFMKHLRPEINSRRDGKDAVLCSFYEFSFHSLKHFVLLFLWIYNEIYLPRFIFYDFLDSKSFMTFWERYVQFYVLYSMSSM